jgi:GT2 family glycosyltransferase
MMVSVIIPTRNRAESLAKSLAALAVQQAAPDFEVIVIDNGSTDTTPALLQNPPSMWLRETFFFSLMTTFLYRPILFEPMRMGTPNCLLV